jgi:hypothetical protein
MTAEQFRSLGHDMVDRIAGFLGSIREHPVTPAESPDQVRKVLAAGRALPENGKNPGALLRDAADLLFAHSLFNGHPRFYGYITSSAAPIGILADLLAAAVNANVGAWKLAPMASEIEVQVIRWLAEFIGYPADCAGLLLSGGNMANLTCFLAARAAQAGWDIRKQGVAGGPRLCVYASEETHTWIQKAVDLAGLGTAAIHWIGGGQPMDLDALEVRYRQDIKDGFQPFLGRWPLERVPFVAEFTSGSLAVKLPFDFDAITVHSPVPGPRFPAQNLETRDSPATQALPREHPDFNLCLIEPTSMSWRVVDGEAVPDFSAHFNAKYIA